MMSPLRTWRKRGHLWNESLMQPDLLASPADRFTQAQRVTISDVGGLAAAKERVQDVVEFLSNPKKYQGLGAKIPRNILFTGPHGCGKTLLARAVMGEGGVPAFYASGAEFIFLAMGIGAARLRDTFDVARANKPSFVLIDDIDAFARKRGDIVHSREELEQNQVLIQLMNELDDVRRRNAGVLLLATTSRFDLIEPGLLQPTRFGRVIELGYPDEADRREILQIHLKDMPVAQDVDRTALVRSATGFSGAGIRHLVNEAALLAARRGKPAISMAEFESVLAQIGPSDAR